MASKVSARATMRTACGNSSPCKPSGYPDPSWRSWCQRRWHHERQDGSGYPDGLHGDELPQAVRIVALAETFDAMTSERPYRERLSVGIALHELIRMTPQKYDPQALQALLIQVRRDAVGSNRIPILDPDVMNLSATDVDQLASTLQHRISQDKTFLT